MMALRTSILQSAACSNAHSYIMIFFCLVLYIVLSLLYRIDFDFFMLLLLLIRLFSCFVNVTIITKPPGFVTIFEKKLNEIMYKVCNVVLTRACFSFPVGNGQM